MKKQLYATAAVITLLAPYVVQAEQTAPSTGVQQPDAQLKAELRDVYQKMVELSTLSGRNDTKSYYQQQIGMPYAKALMTDGNPTTLKTQLEAATQKTFTIFKADVEKDYQAARTNFADRAKDFYTPKYIEQLSKAAADPSKTLTDLKRLADELSKKQLAEQEAEKTANEEQAKLAEAKKQAIAEIGQMNELPNSVKNDYYTKVGAATTVADVDAIKQVAAQDVATRKQIAAKKAAAEKILKSKNDLDVGERSDYLNRLEQAGTEAEIDSLLQEAEATAATNKVIFDKREDIVKGIEKLRYLRPKQKADFKAELEELKTEDQLNNVLQEAKKANIQALKDEEKDTVKKTKDILKGIKQLPEVTDESLYKGQMEIWKAVGHLLEGYLQFFDSLNPEKDVNLTDAELEQRFSRLYDAVHYGEMEYIARDLEQKRQKYPDNQEMKDLLKAMFYDTYATLETGGKKGGFVDFINRDIYPRQQKFNALYQALSSKPSAPVTPELTTRQEAREEAVPFQTVTRENPNLPKGEKRLITKGVAGVRTIVEEVKMQGEQIVSRTVVSDTITKPAIDEIVEIGTKEVRKHTPESPGMKDGGGKTGSDQNGQTSGSGKQGQGKNRQVLPKTNATPSILSVIGVALAGLTGLFVKNRKK